ncbi:MAG: APC family permease [Halioglobus sp.]
MIGACLSPGAGGLVHAISRITLCGNRPYGKTSATSRDPQHAVDRYRRNGRRRYFRGNRAHRGGDPGRGALGIPDCRSGRTADQLLLSAPDPAVPRRGGTVEFINRAFGTGIFSGAANVLLLLSYVVLLAVYAYAFGSYGSAFFPESERTFWHHALINAVVVGLVLLNVFGAGLVIRSENIFNLLKMVLLAAFVVAGLLTPMAWERLEPAQFVSPMGLVAGAMLIFLNYEGFELIANASRDVANPQRSLPIAYIGGVLLVIVLYVLIAAVVVGHLGFAEVAAASSHALSVAAQDSMGQVGFVAIAVAALLATSSAINASFFGAGRLAYIIASSGELPRDWNAPCAGASRRSVDQRRAGTAGGQPGAAGGGATMGSAGFLLIFTAVNVPISAWPGRRGAHLDISPRGDQYRAGPRGALRRGR